MKNRIAIIVPSLSGGGGAERTAALLANGLSESGYVVSVYAMSTGDPSYDLVSNINFVKIDALVSKGNILIRNFRRISYLIKEFRSKSPDLIIGYTIQGGIVACSIAKKLGIKTLVCERQDPYQFSKIMRVLRDYLYRYASAAVFQTKDAQDYFAKIVCRSKVIPNFLDAQKMPQILSPELRKPLIVTAGRLSPAKDHVSLIRAFSQIAQRYPEYVLKIYGEGVLHTELEQLIFELNLEKRIVLCGRSDDIFNEIKEARVFVLSSKYEGYPNALLEAMAMGLACISTDCPCGGPRAMIKPGYNGELVPVGDTDALSVTLSKLLDSEEILYKYMNNGANMRVDNDRKKILESWLLYIKEIINDPE